MRNKFLLIALLLSLTGCQTLEKTRLAEPSYAKKEEIDWRTRDPLKEIDKEIRERYLEYLEKEETRAVDVFSGLLLAKLTLDIDKDKESGEKKAKMTKMFKEVEKKLNDYEKPYNRFKEKKEEILANYKTQKMPAFKKAVNEELARMRIARGKVNKSLEEVKRYIKDEKRKSYLRNRN